MVTRAQMASFLVRAYEHLTGETLASSGDAFGDDDDSVHEENIDRAAWAGLTGGRSDGEFDPSSPTRRDQMATFLARLLALLVEEGHTSPPPGCKPKICARPGPPTVPRRAPLLSSPTSHLPWHPATAPPEWGGPVT